MPLCLPSPVNACCFAATPPQGVDLAAAPDLEDCDMHWGVDVMAVRCTEKMVDVLSGGWRWRLMGGCSPLRRVRWTLFKQAMRRLRPWAPSAAARSRGRECSLEGRVKVGPQAASTHTALPCRCFPPQASLPRPRPGPASSKAPSWRRRCCAARAPCCSTCWRGRLQRCAARGQGLCCCSRRLSCYAAPSSHSCFSPACRLGSTAPLLRVCACWPVQGIPRLLPPSA